LFLLRLLFLFSSLSSSSISWPSQLYVLSRICSGFLSTCGWFHLVVQCRRCSLFLELCVVQFLLTEVFLMNRRWIGPILHSVYILRLLNPSPCVISFVSPAGYIEVHPEHFGWPFLRSKNWELGWWIATNCVKSVSLGLL
jgi:hypothetical protein